MNSSPNVVGVVFLYKISVYLWPLITFIFLIMDGSLNYFIAPLRAEVDYLVLFFSICFVF